MAVHLDDPTRVALATACAALMPHVRGLPVAWVPPENFHITLKFLGAIEEARVAAVVEALQVAIAGHRAFTLEIRGLGAFPSPTRPRVLWAGVDEGRAALARLGAAVEDGMAGLGFEREERPFAPHVTLARVREPRRAPALAGALAEAATQPFGKPGIDHVALMRSHLSPRGARYTALTSMPLTP